MIRAALLSALLLAGCATVPRAPASLLGDWHLVRLDGRAVSHEATITFREPARGYGGTSQCSNSFGEPAYTVEGGRLVSFGLGIITTVGCSDAARQGRERVLTDIIWHKPKLSVTEDRLVIAGPNGHVAEFARGPE